MKLQAQREEAVQRRKLFTTIIIRSTAIRSAVSSRSVRTNRSIRIRSFICS